MTHRRTPFAIAAALAALAAAPLPAQVAPAFAPGAPLSDLVLAQAASEDLVAVFADYYRRHPIGSTLAPSTLRVLTAEETAGLPDLPSGQRYAETEGLIVKIDGAYKLLGIARRAPTTTAEAPQPAPEPEPAPAPDGGADATAEASANATVNITINEDDDDEEDGGDDEEEDGSQAISVAEAEARGIRIPGGHRPEPGACRLWIPGTPPGRQPRGEVSCDTDDIPDGALLIRG